jgi:hypothetical protein
VSRDCRHTNLHLCSGAAVVISVAEMKEGECQEYGESSMSRRDNLHDARSRYVWDQVFNIVGDAYQAEHGLHHTKQMRQVLFDLERDFHILSLLTVNWTVSYPKTPGGVLSLLEDTLTLRATETKYLRCIKTGIFKLRLLHVHSERK